MANSSTMAMRNAEAAKESPKRSYVDVVASPARATRSKSAKIPRSAKSGNNGVANPVEQSKISPPPPPERASPVPSDDEDVDTKLCAKNQKTAELTAEIAKRNVAKVTISTETADVPLDSATYWVEASANNN